jgi:hypothetical protein
MLRHADEPRSQEGRHQCRWQPECGILQLLYEKGVFLSPEIDTVEKMQAFCIQKLKEKGVPGFVGWILTRKLPKLKRWAGQ